MVKDSESLSTENERAREVGDNRERERETYRQKDYKKDRVVCYTTQQCTSCSFVLLWMLQIMASDVSLLGLFETRKSDNMLLIK